VVSYLRASQPKLCKHLYPPPCVPHIQPTQQGKKICNWRKKKGQKREKTTGNMERIKQY
jgi:hypothetical protein